jgi:hypothetical protein
VKRATTPAADAGEEVTAKVPVKLARGAGKTKLKLVAESGSVAAKLKIKVKPAK